MKRKLNNAAANKAKAAADAADATVVAAAAASAATATATVTDAASCAAAAAIAPAEPACSGSAAPAIGYLLARATPQLSPMALQSLSMLLLKLPLSLPLLLPLLHLRPQSYRRRSSYLPLLLPLLPAAMADVTGDAFLPPSAQDFHTTTLKSPKKCDKIAAAVGHGATDASFTASKSRYPSRRNAGIITTNVGGASSHPLAKDADADPINPSNLASLAAKKCL